MTGRQLHLLVPITMFLTALAAACSSGAAGPAVPAPAAPAATAGAAVGAPTEDGSKPGDGSTSDGSQSAPGASIAPGQQLIVYTGTLDLQVDDVRASVDQADQLVAGIGGHVAASNATTKEGADYATVTYRIPAEKWDEALTGLRAIGVKVLNETTKSEDVTGQVVDLNARIANAQASEAALQGIMARASSIPDVLKVQDELSSVQGDIESMTAQRDLLANQAALATLEVDFETAVTQTQTVTSSWDLGQQIDDAFSALVRVGQGLTTLLVWLVVVVVPVFVPLLILLAIAIWLRRRWVRNHPRPQLPGPPVGTPSM